MMLIPALLALSGCATAEVAMKLSPELAATTAAALLYYGTLLELQDA